MEQIVYLLILALVCAACASWAFYARGQAESPLSDTTKRSRQTALIEPFMLPVSVITLFVMAFLYDRSEHGNIFIVGLLISLFLYIGMYYAVLLCALPLLRRFFSARACATLWLLPNFLYLFSFFRILNGSPPLLTLTLPRRWLGGIGLVWGAGFVLVLLWQIVSHFRYRRFLLRGAEPVRGREWISLWENEQKRRAAKRMIPLLVSDHAQTPLTIGCFPRTMRLVLPHLNYTQEEFHLIFQHEMRHIQRADTRTKALLGFCTALCWFNPLMWVARRKVADDLELSCDELVLTCADEYTRKQYGRLLLDTAGSGRGYTTCLSAAASSLRYRLRNVVKPRQRLPGSILVGLVLFALILGSNTFALADSPDTIQALVFDQALAGGVMDGVFIQNWGEISPNRPIYGWDEDALAEYLGSLTVRQAYTTDTYSTDGRRALIIDYRSETGGKWSPFFLCDGLLFVEFPFDGQGRLTFLLEDEIDWDHIQSLLDFDAENPDPDPAPQPPTMYLYFEEIAPDRPDRAERFHSASTVLRIEQGGEEQEISEVLNDTAVGGVSGFPVTHVQLSFTYEPRDGYEVIVENWDHTESYSVSGDELTDYVLELAPYSAHYTVYGTFETVRDMTYEMAFSFDVELPDES